MKTTSAKTKLFVILLSLCTVLSSLSITTLAAGINYLDKIHVAYTNINYKAGDVPQATATVTEGHCTVAYEYWREIEQKTEGSVWTGTGRYWYSDSDKMASLSADKQITQFEAGHHYSYNIVLTTDRGYFISDDTVVFVGEFEWGKAGNHTNLEIKNTSTRLNIYGIYSVDLPKDSTDKTIDSVSVENAVLNYAPDATPKAAATVSTADYGKYGIETECWEKQEKNSNNILTTVAYWYSKESFYRDSDVRFTSFAQDTEHQYSLWLTAADGYKFNSNITESDVKINGEALPSGSTVIVLNRGKTCCITYGTRMRPAKAIDIVYINGATTQFTVGDKPVFTGKVPDDAGYVYQCEWWEIDSKTGVNSEDIWDKNYENHITAFESGKTYRYGLYLKASQGYYFTADTKLKINGVLYDYKRSDNDSELSHPNEMSDMWIYTNLTATPQASGTMPDYKIIEGANGAWAQNSDGTLTFRANGDFSKFTGVKIDGTLISADNYTAVSGSTIVTLSSNYLSTLSVGSHSLTVVYFDGECSTEFEVKTTQGGSYGKPKTDDNSNLALWIALSVTAMLGLAGTVVYGRRKKVK